MKWCVPLKWSCSFFLFKICSLVERLYWIVEISVVEFDISKIGVQLGQKAWTSYFCSKLVAQCGRHTIGECSFFSFFQKIELFQGSKSLSNLFQKLSLKKDSNSIFLFFFFAFPFHRYHSKLVRICQNDPHYYSYTEVPLICKSSAKNIDFNLAQAAHVAKPGSELAHSLGTLFNWILI